MSEPDRIIQQLRVILDEDKSLAALLERSVVKARELAEAELDPAMFAAFEWPQDLDHYGEYLKRFIRWVPRQSDTGPWENQADEVGDRLSHFF